MSDNTYDDGKRRYKFEDLKYFREIIEKKQKAVLKEIGYLEENSLKRVDEYSGDSSTYTLHMADQGTDAQEKEKAFLFASRENKFLNHLGRAMRRMDEGTYGLCMECSKPIQYARLEAVPHATLCIDCKKAREETGY
ncbi:MAG: TraR/DksA C4-type zinc finger protein [Candidatus Electryonea clarkiae]|nr:TraR/DksA C4-type zinc finger protein [Candidatus Electryonea clarkiae]MDP8288269.1 TraR/DksA C4-type zinc finger protein [Candidatus Electryonea clarkiae]